MPKSVTELGSRVSSDVHIEKNSLPPVRKISFWAPQAEKPQVLRVSADIGSGVTEDADVQWSPAFAQEFEKVQRTLWQRLRQTEIAGTVFGPEKAEFLAAGQRRDTTLVWSSDEQVDVEVALANRIVAERSKFTRLGKSIGIIDGMPPVARTANIGATYGPESHALVNDAETRNAFQGGMDYILGQVLAYPQNGEHRSAPLLRNLKAFRANSARWATLHGRSIVSLESGQIGNAWMVVIPPDNELLAKQKNSIQVSNEGGITLMQVVPVAFTREWAGLVGVHELEHMENQVTGKEPRKPSREQYIDGEDRAYTVEIGAADILSRGGFSQGVDALIEVLGFKTIDDLQPFRSELGAQVIAKNLDRYITPQAPKSKTEAGLRIGLYLMAIGLRLAERNAGNSPEKATLARKEVIATMYAEQLTGLTG